MVKLVFSPHNRDVTHYYKVSKYDANAILLTTLCD